MENLEVFAVCSQNSFRLDPPLKISCPPRALVKRVLHDGAHRVSDKEIFCNAGSQAEQTGFSHYQG